MAVTYDYTGGTVVKTGTPYDGLNKFYVKEVTIDTKLYPAVVTDILQCIDIPLGTYVFNVFVEIVTPQGATCTATVGDDSGAAYWDASTNLNAAAGTFTCGIGGTDSNVTTGKYYAAADTIDLVLGHSATIAVFKVKALCVDVS